MTSLLVQSGDKILRTNHIITKEPVSVYERCKQKRETQAGVSLGQDQQREGRWSSTQRAHPLALEGWGSFSQMEMRVRLQDEQVAAVKAQTWAIVGLV